MKITDSEFGRRGPEFGRRGPELGRRGPELGRRGVVARNLAVVARNSAVVAVESGGRECSSDPPSTRAGGQDDGSLHKLPQNIFGTIISSLNL